MTKLGSSQVRAINFKLTLLLKDLLTLPTYRTNGVGVISRSVMNVCRPRHSRWQCLRPAESGHGPRRSCAIRRPTPLHGAQAHLQAAIPAKGQECPDQVAVSDASMMDNYKQIDGGCPTKVFPYIFFRLNVPATFTTDLNDKCSFRASLMQLSCGNQR